LDAFSRRFGIYLKSYLIGIISLTTREKVVIQNADLLHITTDMFRLTLSQSGSFLVDELSTYHRVCNKSNTTGATNGAELLTLPEHLNSPPFCSGVDVVRSLAYSLMFCSSLFILLSFDHYIVCSSSVNRF